MGWAIGFDSKWNRDIGYGVPAVCDHPKCKKKIDRGLSHVCGADIYGGEHCGLYFCSRHLTWSEGCAQICVNCLNSRVPFKPKKDVKCWIEHKKTHPSWAQWRKEQKAKKNLDTTQEVK